MKLRLPLSLFAALTALFVSLPASVHAVEVPEGYTSYYLADPDELYDFRSGNLKVAFLLDGSVVVSPSSATWWQSGALMSGDSVLFTIEEDGDPYSLTFKDASYQAFNLSGSLRIEDIGRVSFADIISSGAIRSRIVQMLRNKSVTFEGNTAGYGGAIGGESTSSSSQVEISDNYGAVTFTGNRAAYQGGAIYGSVSMERNRGDVNFSGNYTTTSNSNTYGGAIYGTTISIADNAGAVSICGNYASSSYYSPSSYSPSSYGGAIHGTTTSIANNAGDVNISSNYATSNRSRSYSSSSTIDAYSYSYGGAIYGSTISITDNDGAVSISGNYAFSTSSANNTNYTYLDHANSYSYGGAIYGTTISIADNAGFVSISGNYASASSYSSCSYGGAIYGVGNAQIILEGNRGGMGISGNYTDANTSYGGAIYGANNAHISIVNNEGNIDITNNGFSETGSRMTTYGGAIYLIGGELNIRDNANLVTVKGNRARYGGAFYSESSVINLAATKGSIIIESNSTYNNSYSGGAIYGTGTTLNLVAEGGDVIFSGNTAYSGGAVYGEGNTINICNNTGDVSFIDNAASYRGGAIYDTSSVINICNNTGKVSFTGNTAQTGAAIYGGSLVIQNNESVVFEQNLESSGRLRSIYLSNTLADGGKLHVSAAAGKSVTFSDGIYVATETDEQVVNVVLNGSYIASDESEIAQGGDIIFDGGQVEGVLRELLGAAPTGKQMEESRTSYVGGMTNLKAGRLIIRNGAQYNGLGISTTARSGAAVVLENAGMDHSLGSINIRRGTSLELSGCNQIVAGGLTLSSGSTLGFTVGTEQRETASLSLNANLEHFSITLALDGADMLASGRYKLVELADVSQYSSDDSWIADDITVTATGDAAGLGFDDLVWEDGVLYVEQGKSIWTNAGGDGTWNTTSTNWSRNGQDITYRDGMDVLFDGTAAGTVQLEGEVAPLSVTVENAAGQDYTFSGSGKLTGSTGIVKNGEGELSLATANEHTGGTRLNGGNLRVQHSSALGATTATLSTAAGSRLSIENGAQVVLAAAEGNDLAGSVSIAAGASLEMQGSGYRAESTQLAGELVFNTTGVSQQAGSLSGSGHLKVQGAGTAVQFDSAASYAGSISLANGAALTTDVLKVGANATLAALAAGASVSLGDMVGTGAAQVEMQTTKFESYTGTFNADVAANTYSAGTLSTEGGLVLQGGATYQASGSSLDLGGSTLTLAGSAENPFISLMLSLDKGYTPVDTQIVLFSGVSAFTVGGVEFSGSETAYVFSASDYLQGDYVFETTALVYDGNVGVVYLVEAVPEPATTTLSLLALAGLCARRRRASH